MPNRVTFLIDGFNLYHSLSEAETATKGTKWLNIWGMCKALVPNIDPNGEIVGVYYFSAYAYFLQQAAPGKIARHKIYVEALQASGVQIKLGRFKRKYIKCKICQGEFRSHEEKETDVNIALKAAHICATSATDTIVLVTGDTDLVPALDHIKHEYPSIRRAVAFPRGRVNSHLRRSANIDLTISDVNYFSNQFPNPYITPGGKTLNKPQSW